MPKLSVTALLLSLVPLAHITLGVQELGALSHVAHVLLWMTTLANLVLHLLLIVTVHMTVTLTKGAVKFSGIPTVSFIQITSISWIAIQAAGFEWHVLSTFAVITAVTFLYVDIVTIPLMKGNRRK